MVKCSRKLGTATDLWVSSNDKFSNYYAGAWQMSDSAIPLLVVRLLVAALAVAILIWSMYMARSAYWCLYLTNWGLLLVTLMEVFGLTVSVMATLNKLTEGGGELPWYVTTYWFFYNVAVTVAFMISALYWILLYDAEAMKTQDVGLMFDVATHGLNSCMAFAEVVMSRTPVYLLHLYQPLAVGLWYAVFTGLYYVCGGKDPNGLHFIYEILDWQHWRRSMSVVALAAAGLVVLYLVLWGGALCRDRLTARWLRPPATVPVVRLSANITPNTLQYLV